MEQISVHSRKERRKDSQRKTIFSHHFPITKVGDGSIITLFNKTEMPKEKSDVVCPHFYELKWANGCGFNCAWCYLNGTYRFLYCGKKPRLKNLDIIQQDLSMFLTNVKGHFLLNSGELSDSLLFEDDGAPLTRKIIPMFMLQKNHKLLVLTKSTETSNLKKIKATESVIVSFSLNANAVAKRWEKAPLVEKRIQAASELSDIGYPVRIRIDPMVPIQNWQTEYSKLIDAVFSKFTPERITFGSLRGLQSTINNSSDKSWLPFLTESSNWGKKVGIGLRLAMYSKLINSLKADYDYENVALCKETLEVWEKLHLDYQKIRCNCVW